MDAEISADGQLLYVNDNVWDLAITGFAGGPTISADGCDLYYHRKTADGFRLFRVRRGDRPTLAAR